MLTPDQVRLRLLQIRSYPHETATWDLLNLLEGVLPDLVALASGRSAEQPPRVGADQARVWHPATCSRCQSASPCERARMLEGSLT